MKNFRPAFELYDEDIKHLPPKYQEINCHIIFDIKFGEDFLRKACFVTGCNMAKMPSSLTYSSVVLRHSIRISLLLAALNEVDLQSLDIQHAYLTADFQEVFGQELDKNLVPNKGPL